MLLLGRYYRSHRHWLETEWRSRQRQNPRFSVRAFARFLGLSSTTLSDILNGKRKLSQKAAKTISKKMGFSRNEEKQFLKLIQNPTVEPKDRVQPIRPVDAELLSDWYHFAILALAELPDHSASPREISARLGISEHQATQSLNLLRRLDFIRIENDKMSLNENEIYSAIPGRPSQAIRKQHHQFLSKADQSLEKVGFEFRDFSTITFAANPDQIPEARKLIKDFRRRLRRLMRHGEPTHVYTVCTQLFPLTETKRKNPYAPKKNHSLVSAR